MNFKAWRKTSLIEYPGKISTVLFAGGCNFRCPFCYNPSLVLESEAIPDLPAAAVLAYLAEHRRLYQAAVVTGGEPTLHEGLPSFMEGLRSLGLAAGLETNGSRPEALGRLLREGLVSFVALDLKGPLRPRLYGRAAGLGAGAPQALAAVRESLALLQGAGGAVELRCTVVPGLYRPRDLLALAAEVGRLPLVLQQFRPGTTLDPALGKTEPYGPEVLERLRAGLARRGALCSLRGL